VLFAVDEPVPSLAMLKWLYRKAQTLDQYKTKKLGNKRGPRASVNTIEWASFKQPIPNPTFSRVPTADSYQLGCTDTSAYFWDPATFWPHAVPIKCLYCGSEEDIKVSWPIRIEDGGCLPVYSLGKIDWLYSPRYTHTKCTEPNPKKATKGGGGRSWNTVNEDFLATLPPFILQQLPGASSTI